jgi:hypothetical protein
VNVCSLFPFTVCGVDDEGIVSLRAIEFQNVNCCVLVASEHAADKHNKRVHLSPFTVCGIDDEGPVSQHVILFQNVNCCVLVASDPVCVVLLLLIF